jgi:hypothetical protein
MEKCLKEIKTWMDTNYLKLNTGKTKLKLFKPNNTVNIPLQLNFCGEQIELTDEINILGVRFLNDLDLNDFASKKVKICSFQIRNLYHIRSSLPFYSRIIMITNTILTNLDYCNSILICANKTTLRRLQLILNRAIRFIFKLKLQTHITPYIKQLHILPIKYRILYKISLICFKIFYRIAPTHFQETFLKFERSNELNLRMNCGRDKYMFKIDVPTHRKESIYYKMKTEWNSLPIRIRKLDRIEIFKSKLKEHLYKQAFPEDHG